MNEDNKKIADEILLKTLELCPHGSGNMFESYPRSTLHDRHPEEINKMKEKSVRSFFSQYSPGKASWIKSLEINLEKAKQANREWVKTFNTKKSNRKKIWANDKHTQHEKEMLIIEQFSQIAKETKGSSCEGLTCVAFSVAQKLKQERTTGESYLKFPNIHKIDMKSADHTFLVIGMETESDKFDLQKPQTWGENSFIVDPWIKCSFSSGKYFEFWKDIEDDYSISSLEWNLNPKDGQLFHQNHVCTLKDTFQHTKNNKEEIKELF